MLLQTPAANIRILRNSVLRFGKVVQRLLQMNMWENPCYSHSVSITLKNKILKIGRKKLKRRKYAKNTPLKISEGLTKIACEILSFVFCVVALFFLYKWFSRVNYFLHLFKASVGIFK